MQLLRRPIKASDQILDIFYVISMEFLSLSPRCSSAWNVLSSEKHGETDVFAGYNIFHRELSLEHFQMVKRMLAPDWTQKKLCIIVPNQWTASPEFFSWVHTRQLLAQSWLVWLMHQRNANSPFQNIVYPKIKDTFPKIQAWAYNRYSRLHRSCLRKY